MRKHYRAWQRKRKLPTVDSKDNRLLKFRIFRI